MGVPVAQKSDSWIAELAMTDCCDGGESGGLGGRPINGGRGGAVEQPESGTDRSPVSPSERVCTPPASRLAGWRRFSSPGPLRCTTPRSVGYEDGEDSERYFSPQSEFSQDTSDTDSMSTSISRMYTFRLGTSSPGDSPLKQSGVGDTSPPSRRSGHSGQYSPSYPWNFGRGSDDVDSSFMNSPPRDDEQNKDVVQPIDFESNQHIWYPPPPQDEGDDLENGFFEYDEDDYNDICDEKVFEHVNHGYGDDDDLLGIKGKHNIAHKEFLRNSLHGHFRALVSQLLQGHGIDPVDGWSDIVSSLAWQAATFVRPDTSTGGSMDPTDYVKVKCVASGNPNDSTFIKGVVCSKNVKHKRMVSKHENPRLLLLGGALELQKVTNKLASINSILEQEKEYLKNAVAKIEAQRPHVLLVEKSVPLYAQQILAKDISLVLNVKRSLLERISHCTGAQIASSIENITSARLGQCQTFWIERVTECSSPKTSNKKSVKTLMFFDGCPRRLGCTVLLRGKSYEELKKVKLAVQFALFAAYHLSLETSYLADEGATLPKIPSSLQLEKQNLSSSCCQQNYKKFQTIDNRTFRNGGIMPCIDGSLKFLSANQSQTRANLSHEGYVQSHSRTDLSQEEYTEGTIDMYPFATQASMYNGCLPTLGVAVQASKSLSTSVRKGTPPGLYCSHNVHRDEMVGGILRVESDLDNGWHQMSDEDRVVAIHDHNENHNEYFPTSENPQSILVSLSIACPLRGIVCKQSQLFRIKFYGTFDKPLGRYFREDLFVQTSCCESCKEPAESHVRCYTHQQGSLTISVRTLASVKLPGEHDGKIWMWHRCLRCKPKDGIPPATQRVVMSDAARGLSFGKFLELSFSNHTTANRIARCGHSLQRDCLRFYGFGSMVAVFRYSPVHILSVNLPPSVLDFTYPIAQDWVIKEAACVARRTEQFYREIVDKLGCIEEIVNAQNVRMKSGLYKHVTDLKDLIKVEWKKYDVLLGFASINNLQTYKPTMDVLELNRLRRELVIDAHIWDRRLYMMHSLTKENCCTVPSDAQSPEKPTDNLLEDSNAVISSKHGNTENSLEHTQSGILAVAAESGKPLLTREQNMSASHLGFTTNILGEVSLQSIEGYARSAGCGYALGPCEIQSEGVLADELKTEKTLQKSESSASNLSDRIDLAWTGSSEFVNDPSKCSMEALPVIPAALKDDPSSQKVIVPVRIKSFDSAVTSRNRLLPVDDSNASIRRSYSQRPPKAIERTGGGLSPTFMNRLSLFGMMDGEGRLLLPQNASDVVVPVYDDEPSSMIAHAMTVPEYHNFLLPLIDEHNELERSSVLNYLDQDSTSRNYSDGSMRSYGSDQPQPVIGNDSKDTHLTVLFEDEDSYSVEKAKFSVTCYFAKQFDAIRRKCCPDELDYIRSLSRCKRWGAQGGKSNVYFAKTLDDRFVIKQVTRTELDSFEDYAAEYFKYLTESVSSGSPTCLAKVLGLYQVVAKNLRDGKELKMDVMVMENLFFKRKVSRIYDLKGSLRSRYNPDTSGNNKVLLDLNLLETLHTKPIFLGSKAKRRLERAVWNDTSFLASVDVMDYSLLVGIDEESKELVMGIIDYLRQYTWDKQLETWVKASRFLGGSKDVLPTIISPDQYKKRFRKAMSKYFFTLPDQWSP
ncbi:1-phosphatidylinositol-3-phosphate 5-kinase FAB1B-like isoform X2 [Phragmites australis]|uniref:1-phosphatidylinositol-3-phosphate 5-kinase FAB1B-like isoform X2 n=1 Tax=Phragmites australis TaxID=29695 RepID=UPI002D780D38|nr:1-phosphatidylinositol-3-phosphate 5-kinase FAB1B-like isoform X2 [Phragmites australis]